MRHAAPGASRQQRSSPATGPVRHPDQLAYWMALCGALLGLLAVTVGASYVRGGTLGLAGVLLAAAVARLVLPERRAGMLRSRRRLADAAALGALGISVLVAGLVLPAPP